MSEIVNPVQSIIAQAAKLKDSKQIEKYRQRLEPHNINSIQLILIDISGSMSDWVVNKRKIDVLRQALARPLHNNEVALAFHSVPLQLYSLQEIPEPQGGTALHCAIATSLPYRPAQTLVISDGKPDDPKQALTQAQKIIWND